MNAQLNIVDISIPSPSEVVVSEAQKTLAQIQSLHITDAQSAVDMQQRRQALNTKIKELNAERTSLTKPIDEAKARVMAFFKRPIDFLELALKHCDKEIVDHNGRLEAERRERQRQAELEAQRERQRLAAIAEETRKREAAAQAQRDLEARQRREAAEAEQRRVEEAAAAERRAAAERQRAADEQATRERQGAIDRQKKADEEAAAARAAGDAEAARLADERRRREQDEQAARDRAAEQQRLQAQRDQEERDRRAEAERLRVQREADEAQREADRHAAAAALTVEHKTETFETRAATTVAAVPVADAPKVAGVSMRDNWTYEITDPTKIRPAFMTPDTVKIGKLVKALRLEAAEQIGEGVRVFNQQVVASKRAGA